MMASLTQRTAMSDALLTVRISDEEKTKLELLAKDMKRSKSFLAAEAIGRFLEEESQIIEDIQRGLKDAKAGRVTSHAKAMKKIYATIDKTEKKSRV